MQGWFTPTRLVIACIALLAVLFAIGFATREDMAEKPYLRIAGGGFIFNYRLADNHYGFTAVVSRPLESGAIIEAAFENPAGGPPLMVRERVSAMTNSYALRSPPLKGIAAHKPYKVHVRVLDREGRREIWSRDLQYASQIGDEEMPDQPLTVGPGYARNPVLHER